MQGLDVYGGQHAIFFETVGVLIDLLHLKCRSTGEVGQVRFA